MGGNGSGGLRVGAGRPMKSAESRALEGSRVRERHRQAAEQAKAPIEPVNPPEGMPGAQKSIWDDLAPHALKARTLTPATASAFADLCKYIVLERRMLEQIEAEGFTFLKVSVDGAGVEHQEPKAHPLLARHTAMLVRVENMKTRFRLTAVGKEIATAVKDEDPFSEFDDAETVN